LKFLRSKAAACVLPFLAVGVWVPQFLGGEEASTPRPAQDIEEDDEDEDGARPASPALAAPKSSPSTSTATAGGTSGGSGAAPAGSNELVDSLVASLQSLEQLTRAGGEPSVVLENPEVFQAAEQDPIGNGASLQGNSLDWFGVASDLTAVLHGEGGGWAMLGGRIVREGDVVTGEIRVLEIGRNWVRLEQMGETRRIELRGFEVTNRRPGFSQDEPVMDDELLVDEGL